METTEKKRPFGDKILVVIGREFGSGGREVGRMVAERLGIGYYDKELLAQAAEEFGISRSLFAEQDERRPSPFRTLLQGLYGIADNFHSTAICGERLYKVQSDVIRHLSEREPCVIVGRTADYVMRRHPGMTSVFLHAPLAWREERIVERGDASTLAMAREMARKQDREREDYYNYYTGRRWGRAGNYHLTADVALLGPAGAAELIAGFVELRSRK